jgi:NADH:ubiquinone oxidoreductase subunit 5 (subunit L)/multisubunit Na+/H+ antiporter MnhA subunit
MPQTAMFFLVGGMAVGGLPPFNGFVSEFLLYSGLLLGIKSIGITYITLMISSLAGLAVIGGISMLTFTKNFGTIFLGTPRTDLHRQPVEISLGMRLPQYFILIIMLSIGLFPRFYFSVITGILSGFIPASSPEYLLIPASLLTTISSIGKFSMVFILLMISIYFIRKLFSGKYSVVTGSTWGGGYVVPSSKMQYTGKSFSKSFGKLLNFIVLEKKKYKEISAGEIFPGERKHSSHYNDLFVTKIFNSIVDRLLYSLNYFQFIQNGKIQLYILYGIFFIVLMFLGTIFKLI